MQKKSVRILLCWALWGSSMVAGCSSTDKPLGDGGAPGGEQGPGPGDGGGPSGDAENAPPTVMTYSGKVTDLWREVGPLDTYGTNSFFWNGWLISSGPVADNACTIYGSELQGDLANPSFAAPKRLVTIPGTDSQNCTLGPIGPWLVARPPSTAQGTNKAVVLAMDTTSKELAVKKSFEWTNEPGKLSFNYLFGGRGPLITTEAGRTVITNTSYDPEGTTSILLIQGSIDDQGDIDPEIKALGKLPALSYDADNQTFCGGFLYALGGAGACKPQCCRTDAVAMASTLDPGAGWKQTRKLPMGAASVIKSFCANGFLYVGWSIQGFTYSSPPCMGGTPLRELYGAKVGPDGMLSQWFKAADPDPTCDDGVSTTPVQMTINSMDSNFAWAYCGGKNWVAPLEKGPWVPPTSSAGGDGGSGTVNQETCKGSDVLWCANYKVCIPSNGDCEYWCRNGVLLQCFKQAPDAAEQTLLCGTSPVRHLCN